MSEVQDVNQGTNNTSDKSGVQDDIQLSAKPFFYSWKLNNVLECLKFSKAEAFSPEFEFAGAKWQLWLKTFCKNGKLNKIKVRLVKSGKSGSGYFIKYKFSLANTDGLLVSKEASSRFWSESVLGHRLSFKYQRKNPKSSFTLKDTLIVSCELFSLSSSVLSNSRIPGNLSPKQVLSTDTCSESGRIQSQSSSQIPKTGTESRHVSAHLLARRHRMMDFYHFEIFKTIIFPVILIFAMLMHACPDETSMNGRLLVNMTEVNALIIDSTLKIRSIAEHLNLTDVKIKSSELLEWYRENYNISDKNFVTSSEKMSDHQVLNASTSNIYETSTVHNSSEKISDHQVLNASTSNIYETATVHNSTEFTVK